MTLKEFIETIADGRVIIDSKYGIIATWGGRWVGQFSVEIERVFTKEILDSKVVSVRNKKRGLLVYIDYTKEDNE